MTKKIQLEGKSAEGGIKVQTDKTRQAAWKRLKSLRTNITNEIALRGFIDRGMSEDL